MSTSKTGKHGHAKVHLVAIDVRFSICLPIHPTDTIFSYQIFTGKKLASVILSAGSVLQL
jgi:hypothetical protein